MHPADKAVLRLAVGLGLSVLVAYGLGLTLPFVACVLAIPVLARPGPPIPLLKGLVLGVVIMGVLVAGVVMVPLLESHPSAGVVLTAILLYAVFLAGARHPGPLATIFVIALTVIPVAGVAEQRLATVLAISLGSGLAIGFAVSAVAHALFPDPPRPPPPPRAQPDATAARRAALQATLVILPVFMLALTNPAMYLAAIMKTVMMGQQAGATNARSAGRELVGSTLVGALMATVLWAGLSLRPNLWMLMLWVVAGAFWGGVRLFRAKASSQPPSFWLNALMTMLIVLGPAIEDSANGKDVYGASAFRITLFVCVACYATVVVWVLERWRAPPTRLTSS